jgi:hypothetical protein
MKTSILLTFLCCPLLYFSQPNTEVFLFDLNTENDTFQLSNFKNVSNNIGYDNQPSFLDDSTILYSGTRNNQTDIVKYNISDDSKEWLSNTEGGEYSPIKIPNKNTVSAVRLEPDGVQKFHGYDMKTGDYELLIDDIIIGYYIWFDKNSIMSSALENDYLSLYLSEVDKNKHTRIEEHIGRSLHHIPNSNLISYISKTNTDWDIKSLNPKTGEMNFIIKTLAQTEDMCWLSDGSLLMAKDGNLFQFSPEKDKNWREVVSLNDYGITNITRLAVSPDGKKLAVVGVDSNQKLAPKLENIKWIAGNWKGEAFGGQTEENWSEPSAGSMMATFKLIDNGKVIFYEIEIIRELEDTLILQLKHFGNDLKGLESKDETVDFPLKEITLNKVVFEGMTFEKISANEMNIFVDIKQENGTVETVKFNYKK